MGHVFMEEMGANYQVPLIPHHPKLMIISPRHIPRLSQVQVGEQSLALSIDDIYGAFGSMPNKIYSYGLDSTSLGDVGFSIHLNGDVPLTTGG